LKWPAERWLDAWGKWSALTVVALFVVLTLAIRILPFEGDDTPNVDCVTISIDRNGQAEVPRPDRLAADLIEFGESIVPEGSVIHNGSPMEPSSMRWLAGLGFQKSFEWDYGTIVKGSLSFYNGSQGDALFIHLELSKATPGIGRSPSLWDAYERFLVFQSTQMELRINGTLATLSDMAHTGDTRECWPPV